MRIHRGLKQRMAADGLITLPDAAKELGLNYKTVRRYVDANDGGIPIEVVAGVRWVPRAFLPSIRKRMEQHHQALRFKSHYSPNREKAMRVPLTKALAGFKGWPRPPHEEEVMTPEEREQRRVADEALIAFVRSQGVIVSPTDVPTAPLGDDPASPVGGPPRWPSIMDVLRGESKHVPAATPLHGTGDEVYDALHYTQVFKPPPGFERLDPPSQAVHHEARSEAPLRVVSPVTAVSPDTDMRLRETPVIQQSWVNHHDAATLTSSPVSVPTKPLETMLRVVTAPTPESTIEPAALDGVREVDIDGPPPYDPFEWMRWKKARDARLGHAEA